LHEYEVNKMVKHEEYRNCVCSDNLKGCAERHVGEARRLISEGDVDGADLQLSYVERHLSE
jgi:hypothetical protein